jgi:hypothetical protein
MQSKCKIPCDGVPRLRDLKERTRSGKSKFIGCSGYRAGDRAAHRCIQLDPEIDEDVFTELMSNGGKLIRKDTRLQDDLMVNDTCSVVLHYRSHKESCGACRFHFFKSLLGPKELFFAYSLHSSRRRQTQDRENCSLRACMSLTSHHF